MKGGTVNHDSGNITRSGAMTPRASPDSGRTYGPQIIVPFDPQNRFPPSRPSRTASAGNARETRRVGGRFFPIRSLPYAPPRRGRDHGERSLP